MYDIITEARRRPEQLRTEAVDFVTQGRILIDAIIQGLEPERPLDNGVWQEEVVQITPHAPKIARIDGGRNGRHYLIEGFDQPFPAVTTALSIIN